MEKTKKYVLKFNPSTKAACFSLDVPALVFLEVRGGSGDPFNEDIG